MAFTYDINKRFYKSVAASGQEIDDYIPADGEKLFIINAGVSSSSIPDTNAMIIWDPDGTFELIISSYGEASQEAINKTITGNGVKKLRICLNNDLTEPVNMGAYYQAEIL